MTATLNIHASSIDSFLDCSRRAIADRYPGLLINAGYKVRETVQYVTGNIGSGVHAAADFLNQDYIATGNLPTEDMIIAAGEQGFDKFQNLLVKTLEKMDVKYTAKFPDDGVIRKHIADYARIYAEVILPTRKLQESEKFFKIPLKDGFQLTSTADGYGDNTVFDLKSGDLITPAYAQVGTYVWAFKASGYIVHNVQLDYLTKAQPGKSSLRDTAHHVVVKYDALECEKIATYGIARLIGMLEEFQATQDIHVFPVNPRSASCNSFYCKLYGTTSCGAWSKE